MTGPKDPLDGYEPPPLAEQIEPYRDYGDDELAVALLAFERSFGGPGISAPCKRGADYHCPNCEADVRGITLDGQVLRCPLCGETPGALTIGTGPKEGD